MMVQEGSLLLSPFPRWPKQSSSYSSTFPSKVFTFYERNATKLSFHYFGSDKGGRKGEKASRTSEGRSLQTNPQAVSVSAYGAISQTAPSAHPPPPPFVSSDWKLPLATVVDLQLRAAASRLTGAIITDTPALFTGQLVRVCGWVSMRTGGCGT